MFESIEDLNLTDFFFDESILKEDFSKVNVHFFESGKKIRGSLVLLIGDILGIEQSKLKTFARVAEMVHNSTLVHDDVIDLSATRREMATVNQLLGNKKAVLTGDYLLSRSLFELTQEKNNDVIKDMAETLRDLVEGEWIQMSPPKLEEVDIEFLKNISDKKTSSLLRWCVLSPLRLVKTSEETIEQAKLFSYHLGIGYQMTDDVLDFSSSSKKSFSLDLINGLPNYVILESYKQSPDILADLLKASKEQTLTNKLSSAINQALPTVASRARDHLDKSIEHLEKMLKSLSVDQGQDSCKLLKAFILSIKERSH